MTGTIRRVVRRSGSEVPKMDGEPDREPEFSWWQEARAIARRHARGASDAADDLAQELAVAALEGRDVARRGAWLERVGRNFAIDGWRAEHRRRELARDVDAPAPPPDPEARVLARERRGVLRRALAALPRPLRRAALARFHADLPFDAVASRLGTPPVTARTRVHRALARLRGRVGGLRVVFAWFPGAQATVLGVTLMAGVARPAAFPVAAAAPEAPPAMATSAHARRVAQAATRVDRVPVASPPAAPAPAPARSAPAAAARAPRVDEAPPLAVQRFSFDPDEIDVDLAGPDGVMIPGEPVVDQPSLIELRRHFLPELLKTLEDI
jgi:RNA polymerase sigma-70 factor (ECF subfamily)